MSDPREGGAAPAAPPIPDDFGFTPPAPTPLPEGVRAALARGDHALAGRLALELLDAGERRPALYDVAAYALEREGRLSEALRLLSRGLEGAPEDPQLLHAVGVTLIRMGRHREALVPLDAALLRRPGFPATLFHRGLALEAIGEDAAARAAYEAAERDPAYPDPPGHLALLAARRGDLAAAEAAAARALALDPRHAAARMGLAMVEIETGRPEAAEARLGALAREPQLPAEDRGGVFGLLGEALHAQGRPAEAFGAWMAGKREGLKGAEARLAGAPDFRADADALAAALEGLSGFRAFPAAPGEVQGGAAGLVFLVGFPRSGTTLLERALAARGDVAALSERATLEALDGGALDGAGGLERLLGLSEAQAGRLRDDYWRIVGASGLEVSGRVLLDKLPLNTLRLAVIARLFPSARVLFALRDPRDVVFSCFRRTFQVNAAMREFATPLAAARFYAATLRAGFAARARLALDVTETRYEDLVGDFEAEAARISRGLGLEPSGRMADFAAEAQDAAIATPSAAQVRRGLYAEGVGQWRPYVRQLGEALDLVEPWRERLGYPAPEA